MYNITGTVKMMIYVTILHFLYSFDGFLEFNFRFTLWSHILFCSKAINQTYNKIGIIYVPRVIWGLQIDSDKWNLVGFCRIDEGHQSHRSFADWW